MKNYYECGRFEIEYEYSESSVCITGYRGRGSSLVIPDSISTPSGELPVTEIGKKALLGCKGLRELTLPDTIVKYGDWAFARCDHLKIITIPTLFVRNTDIAVSFGRRMFDGCNNLLSLRADNVDEDLSYLCAALVARMPSEYLLWDDDIGSRQWFGRWDMALAAYIQRPDFEGYSDKDNALCGEEDISYDGIGSVDGEMLGESYEYIKKVSMNKCNLCLTRCVHSKMLSEADREIYSRYIKDHGKGKSNEAAWLTLIEECSDNLDYFREYIGLTDASMDDIQDMLESLDEDKAQVRAYLISMRKNHDEKEDDIFDSLKLI